MNHYKSLYVHFDQLTCFKQFPIQAKIDRIKDTICSLKKIKKEISKKILSSTQIAEIQLREKQRQLSSNHTREVQKMAHISVEVHLVNNHKLKKKNVIQNLVMKSQQHFI